jgi:hypothetical protein
LRSEFLVKHDLFGKPVSTPRIKSEGRLFRIMLYDVTAFFKMQALILRLPSACGSNV